MREPVPPGLHGPLAWHARLGKEDGDWNGLDERKGTLASAAKKRILTLSEKGLDMGGRDVFSEVGFES